jgi:HEAT repeat protein
LASASETEISVLLNALKQASDDVQIRLLATLYRIDEIPPEIAPTLMPFLLHNNSDVAAWTEWTLARIGPSILPTLLLSVRHDVKAIQCIGQIGRRASDAISDLIDCYETCNSEIRLSSLEALAQIGCDYPRALSLLKETINHDHSAEIQAALRLMGGIVRGSYRNKAAQPFQETLSSSDLVPQDSGPRGEELVQLLQESLLHQDKWVRVRALMVAEELGPHARYAQEALRAALADDDSLVRLQAIRTLGHISAMVTSTVQALIRCLKDEDPDTSYAAALSLASAEQIDNVFVEEITGLLKSHVSAHRIRAALALGSLGVRAKRSWPSLLIALSDVDSEVRRWAAWALGLVEVKHNKVGARLARAIHDSDWTVRCASLTALGQVACHDPCFLEDVVLLLKDPDEMVCEAAARTLLKFAVDCSSETRQICQHINIDSLPILNLTKKKLAELQIPTYESTT